MIDRLRGKQTDLPRPAGRGHAAIEDAPPAYLLIIPVDSDGGRALASLLEAGRQPAVPDHELDPLLPTETLQSAF